MGQRCVCSCGVGGGRRLLLCPERVCEAKSEVSKGAEGARSLERAKFSTYSFCVTGTRRSHAGAKMGDADGPMALYVTFGNRLTTAQCGGTTTTLPHHRPLSIKAQAGVTSSNT
jgi:hypothetical protein